MASLHIKGYKPTEFADRAGPRFNTRKWRQKIISKELYKKWKDKTGYAVTFEEFKRIWKHIAQEIQLGALEEPDGIMLPYGLGEIYIGYVKLRDKVVDYKVSREVGQVVYYENYHSYGKIGKVIYSPCGKYATNTCDLWNFKPITPFKEKATKALMGQPELYKNTRQKKYYASAPNRTTDIPSEESTKDG